MIFEANGLLYYLRNKKTFNNVSIKHGFSLLHYSFFPYHYSVAYSDAPILAAAVIHALIIEDWIEVDMAVHHTDVGGI